MSAHLSLNRFLRVGVMLFAFGLIFVGFTGEAAHAGQHEGSLLAQEDDDDDDDDDDGGQAPVGGVDTGAGGTAVLAQEDDDDDDDGDDGGQAPVGGVDTGAGGTASSNGGALPFILGGGGAALLVGAGTALRRRFSA